MEMKLCRAASLGEVVIGISNHLQPFVVEVTQVDEYYAREVEEHPGMRMLWEVLGKHI